MSDLASAAAGDAYLTAGTAAYRKASLGLFLAGYATFAQLYCVQPLLPEFARDFDVSPATSSLALSLTTGVLAGSLVIAGTLAEARGRKGPMVASLIATACLLGLTAMAPDWHWILVLRALSGLALSGVPAIAMAYLAEEVSPAVLGRAMGLFVGGSAFGGMSGRLMSAAITDWTGSWRIGLGLIALLGLGAGLAVWRLLPRSRRFKPDRALRLRHHLAACLAHLRDQTLRLLFLSGFLLMGGFVTVYNYLTFRLLAPPFDLSQTTMGLVFLAYILGMPASPFFGGLADRLGRGRVMAACVVTALGGLLATLSSSLIVVGLGLGVFTGAFFGAHSIASAWVGARAQHARAQASSLYLFCYYAGSSLIGSSGGWIYHGFGWSGIVALVALLLVIELAAVARLMRRTAPGAVPVAK